MALAVPDEAPGRKSRNSRLLGGVFAVAIIIVILVASIGFGVLPSPRTSSSSSSTSSSPTSSSLSTSNDASSGPPILCAGLTPAQVLSNARVANGSAAGNPSYDEQLLMGFERNFTSSIAYNVTIRAQNDSSGFGPAYLLNGLTDTGYWYQVGIAWNLPTGESAGVTQGFRFVYEVWNTNTSLAVYPRTGGTIATRFLAGDGDTVQLSLDLTLAGQVSMTAQDWNTSAHAAASYGAFGATQFMGFKDKVTNFPTSLLTEWYHALPYFCSGGPVVYSNNSVALDTAWLRIDEWNLTGISASQRFNSSDTRQCCVFGTGYQGIDFQRPLAFQSLTTNGTTIYANAHEFVTP